MSYLRKMLASAFTYGSSEVKYTKFHSLEARTLVFGYWLKIS